MKTPSLNALIKLRQADDFVGRQSQIETFESNFSLPLDQRLFVFNIFGQGGVGKTYLLRRFRLVAEQRSCTAAVTDEADTEIPTMLNRLADQLKQSTRQFSDFFERYEHYRRRRNELSADPEVPPSIIAGSARGVARAGLKLARRAPGIGVVLDFVDDDAAAEQASEWAMFLARKLSNKDDVLLLREPASVLTPLFINGLGGLATADATVLQFDTYERTAVVLDHWLRHFLSGRFGDLPANLVLCISGQYELDATLWAAYSGVIAKLSLTEFTIDEAREYLARKQITDTKRITSILDSSGRLPVLIATLADAAQRGDDMSDQSLTATERFLKWIDDPILRQLAIDAALPRLLDRDVLAIVLPTQSADESLQWLRRLPFVRDASKYHDLVRAQILRHKRRLYPSSWASLHSTLAAHYRSLSDKHKGASGSIVGVRSADATFNAAYHELCGLLDSGYSRALELFCEAFDRGVDYAKALAATVEAAAKDCESPALHSSAQLMNDFLAAWRERYYPTATTLYKHVLQATEHTESHIFAVSRYGLLLLRSGRPTAAIAELNKVLQTIGDTNSRLRWRTLLTRGAAYRALQRRDEALADLDAAILLFHDSHEGRLERGQLLREMGRYDEALAEFRSALNTSKDTHRVEKECALTFEAARRFPEASEAVQRAIAAYPACLHCWRVLVRVRQNYESVDAVAERLAAIPFADAPESVVLIARGRAFQMLGRHDEALADFSRAAAIGPDISQALRCRGRLLAERGQKADARADFDAAVIADPAEIGAVIERGYFFAEEGQFDLALRDFDMAAEYDYARHAADSGAAAALLKRGSAAEADQRAARALAIRADCEDCWGLYGEAIRQLHGEDRVAQILTSLSFAPEAGEPARIARSRGIAMNSLGIFSFALDDLTFAISGGAGNSRTFAARAQANFALSRYSAAADDLRAALELDDGRNTPRYNDLGLWLTYSGRYEEAIHAYQRAAGVVVDHIVLYNIAVARVRLVGESAASDDLARARTALEKCRASDELIGVAEYGLAGLASVTGHHADALELLEKALGHSPGARTWTVNDVAWLDLRSDPAFLALVNA